MVERPPATVKKRPLRAFPTLSESTIKRRIADGTLKAKRDHNVWLIDYKSLMKMIGADEEVVA